MRKLPYDVCPNLRWDCEVRDSLDDAAQRWACSKKVSKIEKKLMAVALGLLLGLPGAAKADVKFTFTTIDVPLPPPAPPNTLSSNTVVNGNSPNAIAGQYDDSGGNTHGFILRGSAFTTIDVPKLNVLVTIINGINAGGQLNGTYQDSGGFHAFFSPSQGVFTTLTPPGSVRSLGGSLNSQGENVGTYRTSDMKRHGFLWSRGAFIMTPFNVPNDHPVLGTVAFGINDQSQIVGDYVDATDGNRHGFLLSQGTYTKPLDPPGSTFTVAEGINNAGVIVGVYFDANGQHGFLLKNGVYTQVDVPGATATAINSINPQGEIAGYYNDASGNSHGFVGTPTDQTAMR
jgi:hypothetical protein